MKTARFLDWNSILYIDKAMPNERNVIVLV